MLNVLQFAESIFFIIEKTVYAKGPSVCLIFDYIEQISITFLEFDYSSLLLIACYRDEDDDDVDIISISPPHIKVKTEPIDSKSERARYSFIHTDEMRAVDKMTQKVRALRLIFMKCYYICC